MSIVCLSICIILLLIFIIAFREKIISPIVLFLSLWTFIIFLSNLNLYNIVKPNDESYLLIMIMIIFYSIGYIFENTRKIKKQNVKKTFNINKKIYNVLLILTIIFAILDIYIIFDYYFSGYKMWQLRNWSLQPFGSSNPILDRRSFLEELLRTIIIGPFNMLIYPMTAYTFFYNDNKKIKYSMLISSLLIIVLHSLSSGGGRIVFIYYIGCFLIAYYLAKKKNTESTKKYKKNIKKIIFISLGFIILYTIIRVGVGNLFKQIYTYFALPPTLLSIWLEKIKVLPHTYGFLTTFGFHTYIFRGFDAVGLNSFIPDLYNTAYSYILNAEKFMETGYGNGNAFVTPVYYFYLDGGYIFVIMASLLFGYISSKIYKKTLRDINIKSFTYFCLLMYGVFISFSRIQTCIPTYVISFLLVPFIIKLSKIEGDSGE